MSKVESEPRALYKPQISLTCQDTVECQFSAIIICLPIKENKSKNNRYVWCLINLMADNCLSLN